MCGIFGLMAPHADPRWRAQTFKNLAISCKERGKDATGVMYFNEEDNIEVLKTPDVSDKFVYKDEVKAILANPPEIMVGHCRAATKGDRKDNRNNHPIFNTETGIAMVHNGSVEDDIWRTKDENGYNPYIYRDFDGEVDSEAVLRLVETMMYIPRDDHGKFTPEMVRNTPKDQWYPQVDMTKAIDDAVYNMSGAFACVVMYENEPDRLYFWRNADRPMYISYVPDHEAVVFASTEKILKDGLRREYTHYKMDFFPVQHKEPLPEFYGRSLPTDTLLTISLVDEGEYPVHFGMKTLAPSKAPLFEFNEEAA